MTAASNGALKKRNNNKKNYAPYCNIWYSKYYPITGK